jgi:hypothetical protein
LRFAVRIVLACAPIPSQTGLPFMSLTGAGTLVAFASTFRATLTLAGMALCTVIAALAFALSTALRALAHTALFTMMTGFALVRLTLPLMTAGRTRACDLLPVVRTWFTSMPLTGTCAVVVLALGSGTAPHSSCHRRFRIRLLFLPGAPGYSHNHKRDDQEFFQHLCLLSLSALRCNLKYIMQHAEGAPCSPALRPKCVCGIIPQSPWTCHKKVTKVVT